MRGQKYTERERESAFTLLTAGNSISAVAKELGIPRTTIKGWVDRQTDTERLSREEIHKKNKERFADDAWKTIHAGNELLCRRFERAVRSERELDHLLDELLRGSEALSAEQVKDLIKKFGELKLLDVGKVAVVLGTLYDKQALIAKEATSCVELADVKFEDI